MTRPFSSVTPLPGKSIRFAGAVHPDVIDESPLALRPNPKPRFVAKMQKLVRTVLLPRTMNIQVSDITIEGAENLRQAYRQGYHLLTASNHTSFGDVYLVQHLMGQVGITNCCMATLGTFKMGLLGDKSLDQRGRLFSKALYFLDKVLLHPLIRQVMVRAGVFPMHNDAGDTQSVQVAVDVLKSGVHPLTIYPEGHVTNHSEELARLEPGVALIAYRTAKSLAMGHMKVKATKDWIPNHKVAIVPMATTYDIKGDYRRVLGRRLNDLETRLGHSQTQISEKPAIPDLIDQANGVWRAALHHICRRDFPRLQPKADLGELHQQVMGQYLHEAEEALEMHTDPALTPIDRMELMRKELYKRLHPHNSKDKLSSSQRKVFLKQVLPKLNQVYNLQQLIPGYMERRPGQVRVAETLHVLEILLLGKSHLYREIPRKATIRVGEPLYLEPWLQNKARLRTIMTDMTQDLGKRMQRLIDARQPEGIDFQHGVAPSRWGS